MCDSSRNQICFQTQRRNAYAMDHIVRRPNARDDRSNRQDQRAFRINRHNISDHQRFANIQILINILPEPLVRNHVDQAVERIIWSAVHVSQSSKTQTTAEQTKPTMQWFTYTRVIGATRRCDRPSKLFRSTKHSDKHFHHKTIIKTQECWNGDATIANRSNYPKSSKKNKKHPIHREGNLQFDKKKAPNCPKKGGKLCIRG